MAMSNQHLDALKRSRIQLLKDLNVDWVMDYLIADQILVPDDTDIIHSKEGRLAKVRYILDLIEKRGDRAYYAFMKALKDTDTGNSHLHDIVSENLRNGDERRHAAQQPQVDRTPSVSPREAIKCTESPPYDSLDASPLPPLQPTQSTVRGYDYAEGRRNMPRSPDKILTETVLGTLASKLGQDWEQLATQLAIPSNVVYRAKEENPFNLWAQVFAMLVKWKNMSYPRATIGVLVAALVKCDIGRELYEFLFDL